MRPCKCDKIPPRGEPYSTVFCRLCYLFHNDEAYRKLWSEGEEEPSLPGMAAQGINFLAALTKHASQGFPQADEKTLARRLELCGACEFYRASDKRCGKCGCAVEVKAAWQGQACPIGKW